MRDRPILICFVAVALLLYSLAALCSSVYRLNEAEKSYAAFSEKYAAAQAENLRLSERLDAELTDDEIEALARKRFGFVMPGERIFLFN